MTCSHQISDQLFVIGSRTPEQQGYLSLLSHEHPLDTIELKSICNCICEISGAELMLGMLNGSVLLIEIERKQTTIEITTR